MEIRSAKIHLVVVACLIGFGTLYAKDTQVDGYYRKDGTYVQPHHRSSPDSNRYDNYSTKGNANPYTGKEGTVDPYKSDYGYKIHTTQIKKITGSEGLK